MVVQQPSMIQCRTMKWRYGQPLQSSHRKTVQTQQQQYDDNDDDYHEDRDIDDTLGLVLLYLLLIVGDDEVNTRMGLLKIGWGGEFLGGVTCPLKRLRRMMRSSKHDRMAFSSLTLITWRPPAQHTHTAHYRVPCGTWRFPCPSRLRTKASLFAHGVLVISYHGFWWWPATARERFSVKMLSRIVGYALHHQYY